MHSKYFSGFLLAGFLAFFLVAQISHGYNSAKEYYKRNDVIKEAMDWLKQNSNKTDFILVGDPIVYQYFTDNPLIGYSQASGWVGQFLQKNRIKDPLAGYAALLASNNIKYFVAYDSTMSWFYKYTKEMALGFYPREYNFKGAKVRLVPLKKFEEHGESVILYKVEVEITEQNKTEEQSNPTENSAIQTNETKSS